jgi:hypothetical protein
MLVVMYAFFLDELYQQQDEVEFPWLLHRIKHARSLLEIGSCYGCALLAFAVVMGQGAKLRSIDLGENDNPAAPCKGDVLNARIDRLCYRGYDADVLFADSNSMEAISWAHRQGPYDVVFIDGDHSYEGVANDWHHYGPLGKLVAFHDIANPCEPGPGTFWRDLTARGGMLYEEKISTADASKRRAAKFVMGIGVVHNERVSTPVFAKQPG